MWSVIAVSKKIAHIILLQLWSEKNDTVQFLVTFECFRIQIILICSRAPLHVSFLPFLPCGVKDEYLLVGEHFPLLLFPSRHYKLACFEFPLQGADTALLWGQARVLIIIKSDSHNNHKIGQSSGDVSMLVEWLHALQWSTVVDAKLVLQVDSHKIRFCTF